MQWREGRPAQSRDVSSVGRNLRLDQRDVESGGMREDSGIRLAAHLFFFLLPKHALAGEAQNLLMIEGEPGQSRDGMPARVFRVICGLGFPRL